MTDSHIFHLGAGMLSENWVERYEIVATLDDRTSEICQELMEKSSK